jgi:ring-1,2-phenylacetyl-CoA epoxidase subunit PaaA
MAAVERWYPEGLDMFGSSTSQRSLEYMKWGLKRHTNEEARRGWQAEVDAMLSELGLDIPDVAGKLKYA